MTVWRWLRDGPERRDWLLAALITAAAEVEVVFTPTAAYASIGVRAITSLSLLAVAWWRRLPLVPVVFLCGLEEGLFPHERLDTEAVDEEEERRLFYVALTRAKKRVYLSFSSMRTIFGSKRINMPSSFLKDIGDELMVSANPTESGYENTIDID